MVPLIKIWDLKNQEQLILKVLFFPIKHYRAVK